MGCTQKSTKKGSIDEAKYSPYLGKMLKKHLGFLVAFFTLIYFSGCGSASEPPSAQTPTQKSSTDTKTAKPVVTNDISLSDEPVSYRDYALVASGDIKVQKTLTTDGPLADVHTNGQVSARSFSLDISGKITSSNRLENSIIRSFDYKSTLKKSRNVTIRALKVNEFLNTTLLDEYYILQSDGKVVKKSHDKVEPYDSSILGEFVYEDNRWIIKGDHVAIDLPLKVETSLKIMTNSLFITGSLMVQGSLKANGELNINTGSPFEKALVVDKNIEVDKLVTVGRVYGSSDFKSLSEVNIVGNAEIDGDVELYGDTKINLLDNVYKSALYEAQEEALEANTTMTLVHSQLFSNVKGKNSVVLFTFVEGEYLINENTLLKLIENNETDKFKFKSYLYGASIDYGSQLQKFDDLSPYYENKLKLIKKLKAQGYENLKISESLDIAPSNLYHSFQDEDGNDLGTYNVYSLSKVFDIDNLTKLTQKQKDDAIYAIDHKDEIEEQQEQEAKQKQNIIDNNETNLSIKSQMLSEIESAKNNASSINKETLKKETTQDRIQEWVEYKELVTSDVEVELQEVIVGDQLTKTRGLFSRLKRGIKKVFKRITFNDCRKKVEKRTIDLVVGDSLVNNGDQWENKIQLLNDFNNRCVPTSVAMIINYHRVRSGQSSLYPAHSTQANTYVTKLAHKFGTTAKNGTYPWKLFWTVPWEIYKELKKNGTAGFAYTRYTAFWNRAWQHHLIKFYIKHNNPVMYSTWRTVARIGPKDVKDHTMPVIGYKREYYKGVCWKRIMPEKKWILVDTTWNSRGYIRFDARSNYWTIGAVTYIRVW